MKLLQTKNLIKYYTAGWGLFNRASLQVHAVDGAISIERGETLGLVGERLWQKHPGDDPQIGEP